MLLFIFTGCANTVTGRGTGIYCFNSHNMKKERQTYVSTIILYILAAFDSPVVLYPAFFFSQNVIGLKVVHALQLTFKSDRSVFSKRKPTNNH